MNDGKPIGKSEMRLRLDINGRTIDLEPLPPASRLRVAVGEPGRRSALWSIWSAKNDGTLYVAARSIAGQQKFSFHERNWRYAWIGQPPGAAPGSDRLIQRIERGPVYRGGVTKMLSIWVRSEDVTDTDPANKAVLYFAAPPPGRAVAIHLAHVRPGEGWTGNLDAVPRVAFELADGNAVILLTSTTDVPPNVPGLIADQMAAFQARMTGEQREGTRPDGCVAHSWLKAIRTGPSRSGTSM